MNYKGIELQEITEPQIFDPPKPMFVWDEDWNEPKIWEVWSIAPPSAKQRCPVYTITCNWKHCAEIPEQKRATYLQLMEWLAKGNGMWKIRDTNNILSHFPLSEESLDEDVEDDILIRSFGSNEWLEPTLKNMGME